METASVSTNHPQVREFRADTRIWVVQCVTLYLLGLVICFVVNRLLDYSKESSKEGLVIRLIEVVGTFIFIAVIARKKGVNALILGERELTVENKQERTVVLWEEVVRARLRHFGEGHFGGDRWEFEVQNRRGPVSFDLLGYLDDQRKAIQEGLVKRLPCEEEEGPGKFRSLN